MPNTDKIHVVNSGATDLGAEQSDSSKSLGGWPSSTYVHSLAHSLVNPIRGLVVRFISATCGTGSHRLVVIGSGASFASAGDSLGSAVEIGVGETKTLYSSDATKYVVIERTTDDVHVGDCTINTDYIYNSAVGLDDALITDSDDYRLIVFNNTDSETHYGLSIWLDPSTTGLSMALDSPDATGVYRELAVDGETASPSASLSFSSPTTQASAIVFDLPAGQTRGLWVKREIPNSGTSLAITQTLKYFTGYGYGYGYGSTQSLISRYRLGDMSLEQYELYRGVDGPIDFFSVFDASYDLPFETPAFEPDHAYRFCLRRRNRYNLLSQNLDEQEFVIDSDGNLVLAPPSSPQEITATPLPGGLFQITAKYFYLDDDEDLRGDEWLVYLSTSGDPDPETDTPTVVAMIRTDGQASMDYSTAEYAEGATLHVLVRVRRSSDDSDSTNAEILTAVAIGDLSGVVPGCQYVVKSTPSSVIKIWEHDASTYIAVDTNREVMRFVIAGNVVAGLARSGSLHLDGLLIESTTATSQPVASYITYSAGSIVFGAGSPANAVARLDASGNLTIYHAVESTAMPTADWQTTAYYQHDAGVLAFSVDLKKTFMAFTSQEVSGATNGELMVRRIREGY